MHNINVISDLKIGHRNWEEALANAFSLLVSVPPGDVVCITGPSRTGKTRMVAELERLLRGELYLVQAGMMPTLTVEAVNEGNNGAFSTKSFILRLLDAVKHPIFSSSLDSLESNPLDNKANRTTEVVLRRALENALRARKVKYLFIDEAQHARYVSKDAMGAYAVLDSWKCLAQSVGLVLIIVGAYPILKIIRNSPHLVGRKHTVHLPRYRFDKSDLREYAAILMAYESRLDLCPTVRSLVKSVVFFQEGTAGCIGLLRAWLLRAQAMATALKQQVSMAIIERTRLSDDDLRAIQREIEEGELLLSSSPQSRDLKEVPNLEDKPRKTTRAQKPFQKKPVRRKPGHRTGEDGELCDE